jgi:hypothetical protein
MHGTVDMLAIIHAGAHNILMRLVKDMGGFIILPRMRDYYANTNYTWDEVPPLLEEIQRVRGFLESAPNSAQVVARINDQADKYTLDLFRQAGVSVDIRWTFIDSADLLALLRRLEAITHIAREEQRGIRVVAD